MALLTHGFDVGGGVPTVTVWLREALTARGYTVDIHDLATSHHDPASRRLTRPHSWTRASLRRPRPDPTLVNPLGRQRGRAGVRALPGPRVELTRTLRGYDLLQVVAGGPAWAMAASRTGVPIVIQVASLAAVERAAGRSATDVPTGLWRRTMTGITTNVERRALRGAHAVLVENAWMLDRVRQLGQPRVILAPPGVDTTRFTPHPTGRSLAGPLLSVARLSDPRKGIDRTIRAYAEVTRQVPLGPDLVLAGRGPLPTGLATLIADLGLTGRILVRADVDRDELLGLYRQASVFIQTSHEEGLGLAVLEAMACGLPVVATDTERAGTRETDRHRGHRLAGARRRQRRVHSGRSCPGHPPRPRLSVRTGGAPPLPFALFDGGHARAVRQHVRHPVRYRADRDTRPLRSALRRLIVRLTHLAPRPLSQMGRDRTASTDAGAQCSPIHGRRLRRDLPARALGRRGVPLRLGFTG